tara:strand:- start:609 stop:758 length:150 start_codon:yes stop_codon:yes gene_type:complete
MTILGSMLFLERFVSLKSFETHDGSSFEFQMIFCVRFFDYQFLFFRLDK